MSWDRVWTDNPSCPWYYCDPAGDTTLHTIGPDGKLPDYTTRHIVYGDKLMVGYRYWTTTGRHPLFPFGFGLSYTTFNFPKLDAPESASRAQWSQSALT
jgi:beta-glucosidase